MVSSGRLIFSLVVPGPDGEEITIWDSKESEFSSGLEYRHESRWAISYRRSSPPSKYLPHMNSISEPIKDLDWTSTGDAQSILAIGYAHHVVLLCQQRMTYFNAEPAWGIFGKVEISQYVVSLTQLDGLISSLHAVSRRILSAIRSGCLVARCCWLLDIKCTTLVRLLQKEPRTTNKNPCSNL